MRGGFSFCGVDIANIGLEYAPEKQNTYVYKPAQWTPKEQMFEVHDGGYFYGTALKPKDFVLRCFYAAKDVRRGIMTNLYSLFRRGRSGRLIFEKRPWLWYNATVINVDTSQMQNYENGLVTITLRAYYPLARTDLKTLDINDVWFNDQYRNSGLLAEADQMPKTEIIGAEDEPMTRQTEILLYNPGTERAKVAIELAGEAPAGLTIANVTNGKDCAFIALSKAVFGEDKWLVSDGLNNKTVLTNGKVSKLAFLYHRYGFMELDPGFPIVRDISCGYEAGSNRVRLRRPIIDDVSGRYIYIGGEWRRIEEMESDTEIVLERPVDTSGGTMSEIVNMNKIVITPADETNFSLTKLNFLYHPTFA